MSKKTATPMVTVSFGPEYLRYLSYDDLTLSKLRQLSLEQEQLSQLTAQPMKIISLGGQFFVELDEQENENATRGHRRANRRRKAVFRPDCFRNCIRISGTSAIESLCRVFGVAKVEFQKQYFSCEAYAYFATILELRELYFLEFLESWCSVADNSREGMASLKGYPEYHIVAESNGLDRHAFRKTPFFVDRQRRLQRRNMVTSDIASKHEVFVYIMEDLRNGHFKIGKSKHPLKRESTLQSEVPQVALRFAIPCDEVLEIELHSKFAEFRIRGEWFSLSPKNCLEIIEKLTNAGDANRIIAPDKAWIGQLFLTSLKDSPAPFVVNDQKIDEAKKYLDEGNTCFKIGNYNAAIASYTNAIECNPCFAKAFSNRALAKAKLNEFNAALLDHEQAVDHALDFSFPFMDRGCTRLLMRDYSLALRDFDLAQKLGRYDAYLFQQRGRTKEALGQFDEAISDYSEAIRIEPTDPDPYSSRGLLHFKFGRYFEAFRDIDDSLRFSSSSLALKAFLLSICDSPQFLDSEQSMSLAERALELTPHCPYSANARSCAFASLERFDLAIASQEDLILTKNARWLQDPDIDGGAIATERIACWRNRTLWRPMIHPARQ